MDPQRRALLLQALRTGTVPRRDLDVLAVGMDRFASAFDSELALVGDGGGVLKAIRGEYGSGKTFTVRWLQERAMQQGFATAEVQISETETPLYRIERVYRRMMERLSTDAVRTGAFSAVVQRWFIGLERQVIDQGVDEDDDEALEAAMEALMEHRLADITRTTPQFAAALRGYHHAMFADDPATAQGLLAWMAGQPNVAAAIKRRAGLKGELDHFGAMSFLRGLLVILRDAGFKGLVLVLDEVETLQRMRTDTRDKSLNALRQLADELAAQEFPGFYLVITGTPSFFDGPQGVRRAPALESRLKVDFNADPRFDNARDVQVRLLGFDQAALVEVGIKVRDLYAQGADAPARIRARVDDAYVASLAQAVAGRFRDVRVAPRLFLKKLVAGVLDPVDQHAAFDPRVHYVLTISSADLRPDEREALKADDIELVL